MEVIKDLLKKYYKEILFSSVGLVLVIVGFYFIKGYIFPESKVEIIGLSQSNQDSGEIVVEIAGAVNKAGVYKFAQGSRVEDLLTAAGGLSESADRARIEKFINRAAKLTDGQKIYIPNQNDQSGALSADNSEGGSGVLGGTTTSVSDLVNINTGSKKQLEDLWGIGPVTAQNIIDHRPYSSVEELLSKKILKINVYEANKDKLTVY